MSGMFSESMTKTLATSLNNTWTPKHVAGVEAAQLGKERINAIRQGLIKQGNLLAITPRAFSKLNASRELHTLNKKMGF